MAEVVQLTCPGCKKVLRIPPDWVNQQMKCKHCGLVFQPRRRAAAPTVPARAAKAPAAAKPVAAKPAANLGRMPPPPARPNAAPPVAVPVAAAPPPPVAPVAGSPFAEFDAEAPPSPRASSRRRRSGGGWWKGALVAVCLLGVAVTVLVLGWPYLARLASPPGELAVKNNGLDETSGPAEAGTRHPRKESSGKAPEDNSGEAVPAKSADNPPKKSADGGRPPRKSGHPETPVVPSESPASSGNFPRRALVISVNNYLYFNPINYGGLGSLSHNVHTLLHNLNYGLHIPVDQMIELSDATPEADGKSGRGPRPAAHPPLKPVIEQTVTDFLATSRAQDRVIVLFIGHAVEMDGEVFLVPIEGESGSKDTLIPLKWLYDKLAASPCRQKVLILDVCRFDPTRGFERPGSGDPDAKLPYSMTAKMDEALQKPPAGVQVWSACVADQYSLEYENNGVFADALWTVAGKPVEGVIQHPEDSIRVDKLLDALNQKMAEELQPYGRKQTSRLAGKEPETGAPYDPSQPPPPRVEPKLPIASGDVYSVDQVRKILAEIELPPVKKGQEGTVLRAEALPPFTTKTMEAYADPGGADTDLRKAVKGAVQTLNDELKKGDPLKDYFPIPADENKAKEQISEYQRRNVAGMQRVLQEALDDLKQKGTPEARAAEPKHWQANYDWVLARLEAELAYLNEYQGLLGQMKKELPPYDKNIHTGWRVSSLSSLSDRDAKKYATERKKILDKMIKDYPNTPWEVLAKRDLLTSLGMEWQATKLGQD